MYHPGSLAMAVSVLLVGTVALAQPQATKRWKRIERSISVNAGTAEPVQELRLAPNVVTTVLFDTDILPEAGALEGLRELFTRLGVQANHLLHKPAVAMPARGVPPLVVRFADTSAPQRLVLVLKTDADEVDSVVEVRRRPATAEQVEAELVALRVQCAALEGRLAAARRPVLQDGLAGAVLSGAIGNGVVEKTVNARSIDRGLKALRFFMYRSTQWVVVSLKLQNRPGAAPWVPGTARLVRLGADGRPTGEVIETPVLLQEERIPPGQSAVAVVQWRVPANSAPMTYELEVMDAARRRGVRWERVEL